MINEIAETAIWLFRIFSFYFLGNMILGIIVERADKKNHTFVGN